MTIEQYIEKVINQQKMVKRPKRKNTNFDDILHYQKIIVALTETNRLMKKIDKIEIE
ncbi:MAG: hypothetical protein ABFS35_20655 [Bacteroidota bacterium]